MISKRKDAVCSDGVGTVDGATTDDNVSNDSINTSNSSDFA